MAKHEIHVGDVGTELICTIKDGDSAVDISAGSAVIRLRKPQTGTVVQKTAVFVSDGTDGQIKYVTVSGDLDEAGTWQIQAQVTISTNTWNSDVQNFEVHPNLVVA